MEKGKKYIYFFKDTGEFSAQFSLLCWDKINEALTILRYDLLLKNPSFSSLLFTRKRYLIF